MIDQMNLALGTLAALTTILGAFVIIFRRKPKLQYKKTYDASLIIRDTIDREVEIRVEGEIISRPRLVSLVIANSGSSSFNRREIDENITVRLPGDTKIRSADITRSTPEDFMPRLELFESGFEVDGCLWNAGDAIEVQIMVDSEEPVDVSLSGRIAEVSIRPFRDENHPILAALSAAVSYVFLLGTLGLGIISGVFIVHFLGTMPEYLALGIIILSAIAVPVIGFRVVEWLTEKLTPDRFRYRKLLEPNQSDEDE